MSFPLYNGPVVGFFVYRTFTFKGGGMSREHFEWGVYENGKAHIQSMQPLDDIIKVAAEICKMFPTIFRTNLWTLSPMPPAQTIRPGMEKCNEDGASTNTSDICGIGSEPLRSKSKSHLIQALSVCYQKIEGQFTISSLVIPEIKPTGDGERELMEKVAKARDTGHSTTVPVIDFTEVDTDLSEKTQPRVLSALNN